MSWIEVNGAALRYDVTGRGEKTLVLVHEMGGTLESWDDVLPALSGDRTVVRYDTRGAGLSEKIRGTGSIDQMADDVASLLDALGIGGKVTIAGIAVGGAIAIHFAARHAARTAGLIPMSPAVGVVPERRTATAAAADALEKNGVRAGIEASMATTYPPVLRTDMARYHRVMAQRLGNDPSSYAAIYRMLNGMDLADDWGRITCPTLFIAGKHDGLRPPAVVEPLVGKIAGARIEVLETAHFMSQQTPELVATTMLRFLDEIGS
ncbi:MAG: alpha/beta fold hydrolase [Hyphomicrobiaceae bacterium]